MGAAMTAVSQMAFTVKYNKLNNQAHRKLRSMCDEASRRPTA